MEAIDFMNNHVDNSRKNLARGRGRGNGNEGVDLSW
jgi:hypothetical protein